MEKKKLNLSEPDIIHRSVFTDIDTLLDSVQYEIMKIAIKKEISD